MTVEGMVFMAIGTVGLLANEDKNQPLLPESSLTNLGLLALGMAIASAAQRPGPRRVVAWVQAIGFTMKLVPAAAGHPIELPSSAAPSALIGAVLLGLAVLSLSAAEADSPPTRTGDQPNGRRGE